MTVTVQKNKIKELMSTQKHTKPFRMLQNAQSCFWKFLPERPTNQVHVTILNSYLGQTFAGTRPFGKPRKKKDPPK